MGQSARVAPRADGDVRIAGILGTDGSLDGGTILIHSRESAEVLVSGRINSVGGDGGALSLITEGRFSITGTISAASDEERGRILIGADTIASAGGSIDTVVRDPFDEAGGITLVGRLIRLPDGTRIASSSEGGRRIRIDVSDTLELLDSSITVEASSGTGGSISINGDSIVVVDGELVALKSPGARLPRAPCGTATSRPRSGASGRRGQRADRSRVLGARRQHDPRERTRGKRRQHPAGCRRCPLRRSARRCPGCELGRGRRRARWT